MLDIEQVLYQKTNEFRKSVEDVRSGDSSIDLGSMANVLEESLDKSEVRSLASNLLEAIKPCR